MTSFFRPEFRTDVLTGLQVLIAPGRSSRPSAMHPEPLLLRSDDPFAEGNEAETPGERFAVREVGSQPNGPGWKLRVVPNRYPAVVPDVAGDASFNESDNAHGIDATPGAANCSLDLFPAEPAFGEHDVVIECPDSRSRLVELSVNEVHQVLGAWQTRRQQLSKLGCYSSIAIFRNEGFSAGASLAHCHSQIVASKKITPLDAERSRREAAHFQQTGREILADLIDAERIDGRRLVSESSGFLVYCPFASRTSWHVRFVPLQPSASSFGEASISQLLQLAELLKDMLVRLEAAIGAPFSFNLTLPHPRLDQPPQFRWMLDLLPRTGRSAGWEFLSSIDIVTVSPEHAAGVLRNS